jgi:hypothetical protein
MADLGGRVSSLCPEDMGIAFEQLIENISRVN